MRNLSTLVVIVVVFLFSIENSFAQQSKVNEFEKKPFYKNIFTPDAFEKIVDADEASAKAQEYMESARVYNQEINDLESIADKTRDDKARISALKKIVKLRAKRLKLLKKAYAEYTEANVLRYSTYQEALPNKRLANGDSLAKEYGFKFERAGTVNKKEAVKQREFAKNLDGEDKRIALVKAYNHEVLALNNMINALRLYYNDSSLQLKQDSIGTPRLTEIAGFFFTVNMGMYNQVPDSTFFAGISPLYADDREEGKITYYVGVFKTYDDALYAQKELVKEGFDGAFVTALENGAQIQIDDAIQIVSANAAVFAIPPAFKIGSRVVNKGEQSDVQVVQRTTITSNGTTTTGATGVAGNTGTTSTSTDVKQSQTNNQIFLPTEKRVKVYQSKEAVLSARLKLNNAEMSALLEASHREEYANDQLADVEQMYSDIEYYKKAEELETNTAKKEEYRDKNIMLQMQVFVKLIKATELHLEVNETRYKIYMKHLPRVRRLVESPAALLGKDYEEDAQAHFRVSKLLQADAAGLEYQADKYMKLMDANDQLLLGIEKQETAFSIYFNLISKDDLAQISTSDRNPAKSGTDDEFGQKRKMKRFIVTEIYVYSKISPNPKRVNVEKGIVFKIQFGLFKDFPKDNFGAITPITVEKLKGLDYSRFLVGNFKTFEAAQEALPIVRSKGYKTAFVVATSNGKRLRPQAAWHLARESQSNYETLVKREIDVIRGKRKNSKPVRLGKIVATDLTTTTGLVYTVQLGVYNRTLSPKELRTTENISFERLDSGAIRYTKGIFSNKKNADREKSKLLKSGFDGAFVVAFYNGRKAALSQIGNSSNIRSAQAKTTQKKKSLIFRLQIAALKEISPKFKQQLKEVAKQYKVQTKVNAKGLKVVTLGEFETYDAAKMQQTEIEKNGFSDSFIVAFKNEKQIPISLARKMQK